MKFNIDKKLAAYSFFTISFLQLAKKAESQVIYVDIDPDTILDEAGDFASFDLDFNGTKDVAFLNSSYYFYNSLFESYNEKDLIMVGPYFSGNALAGQTQIYGYGDYDFTLFFPYALNANDTINQSLNWHSEPDHIMGMNQIIHYDEDTLHCFVCDWYGLYIDETVDGYLAIKLIDLDESVHYGWIRCDVIENGRKLVIKDYAFESLPNHPILAGSKESYVGIDEINFLGATVHSFANIIYIQLHQSVSNALMSVYDISGKKVKEYKLIEEFTSIQLNEPKGIYLIEIISEDKIYSKKIYVQ